MLPKHAADNSIIKEPSNDDALPTKPPNTFKQQPNNLQSIQLNRFPSKENQENRETVKENESNSIYNNPLIPMAAVGLTFAGWTKKAANWFKKKEPTQDISAA